MVCQSREERQKERGHVSHVFVLDEIAMHLCTKETFWYSCQMYVLVVRELWTHSRKIALRIAIFWKMDLTKASLLAHCMGHYKRGGIDEKITYVDHAMENPWSLLDYAVYRSSIVFRILVWDSQLKSLSYSDKTRLCLWSLTSQTLDLYGPVKYL